MMHLKTGISLLILLCTSSSGLSQKVTLSGTIKDAGNGETLFGAQVVAPDLSTGALANSYGFYSLTIPAGRHRIQFKYVGYTTIDTVLNLQENVRFDIEMSEDVETIGPLVVTDSAGNSLVDDVIPGVTKIDPKELRSVPLLLGERDPVKLTQFLPGVKTAGEGSSGFYVRGGGLDQNLILLDEAPVYNASHLLGFFSVFNGDAIKDLTLYKGGIPAEYGGRGSSVLDIKMKDGNNKRFSASGGIGVIASRLTLEAPINEGKGSFIVSGRRTYADLFLKLSPDETLKNTSLYFYDVNAKANYTISEKDRVYLSGYFGRDNFSFGDQFGFDWGNSTGTLRWNHIYNGKLFSNTSIIYSNYNYDFNLGSDDAAFTVESSIRDFNLKHDFSWYANPRNSIKFGVNAIHHTFVPGRVVAGENSNLNAFEIEDRHALEFGAYIQNEQIVSENFTMHYGLRYSGFNYMGEGTAYTFDSEGDILTETGYGAWESITYYQGLEPRLAMNLKLNPESAVKASYNRNYQYLHLLSNTTSSSPTDVWVPSSNNVKPQIVDQVSLGYFRSLKKGQYSGSIETYYKALQNQIDYRTGADLVLNNTVESELVFGKGSSYGLEFYLKKNTGKLTGWISYTLSKTTRQFDDINGGEPFSARQDRTHDIAIVAMYKINKKLTLSANWVYYTGDAVTFPAGRYEINGQVIPYYTERNGHRMPNYHRLDFGLTWDRKKKEKFESSWSFSIYNVYARENAFTITFRESETNPGTTEAVQLSLFKIIPSVTYNFKF